MGRAPVDVFTAIADPSRRDILGALRSGETTVSALVENLSLPQPRVSKHLRVLREARLVVCRAQGRRRLYRLEPASLVTLRDWLGLYEGAMRVRLDRRDEYVRDIQHQRGVTP